MISPDQASDYLITRALSIAPDDYLSVLKLQQLLYYSQAWHLAAHGTPLFDGRFEAWGEGPVNRAMYRRFFKPRKLTYSPVALQDCRPDFDAGAIPEGLRGVMDRVLEAIARHSDAEIETWLPAERPWVKARGEVPAGEPSRNLIDEEAMRQHHAKRCNAARPGGE